MALRASGIARLMMVGRTSRRATRMRGMWAAVIALGMCVSLTACAAPGDADEAIASPRVVRCDEATVGIKARVEEAREILEQRAPAIADELQNVVELVRKQKGTRADVAYSRLRDGLEEIENSSNRLLDRFDETPTGCDESADDECWTEVTGAYQTAGSNAIEILQGPLRSTLKHVEAFFSLDKKATVKETRATYMNLRDELAALRSEVVSFADAHNAAVEEFNSCSAA